ncbi:MAG: bifunctional DNA-formamidopyrimidine glycosylase/DNA-(apurinic or apyrimidinic site) lyase [Proteobacteria bacterium]|nr:bifunctional DNA-formamidopyrimidine glycosylase/DNA-(apurinic or apyrimidinic site) lyase [Pseudomonadota bacterium]
MPELPEVQTIVNELAQRIIDKRIEHCDVLRAGILKGPSRLFCYQVAEQQITAIRRIGKYILIGLGQQKWLITHLRMTGKFILQTADVKNHIHDRVIFKLNRGEKLVFNDVRCFGHMEIVEDLSAHKGIQQQGWDPWDKELTPLNLKRKLQNRKSAVKNVLLDQTLISGLGNIYVCEILYKEKINPLLPVNLLSKKRLGGLIKSTREILELALVHNGTSISDYKRVDEKSGEFQSFLQVYGKSGEACKICGNLISRIKQNQRSTFLCLKCQKN